MTSKVSPFLFPGSVAEADSLSIIHLKRDLQIPTILKEHDEDDEGYFEGKVVNTRFGSFPHRTLIGLPWGSQVRASKVDTGSRGRRVKGADKKRKRDDGAEGSSKATKLEESSSPRKVQEDEDADADVSTPTAAKEEKEAVAASTGFIHLLPPTPENWTSSLPHRTQVVYTPDYSYILHRIRARPGKNIIEAGAGSGSFTHASARAVYSGYPGIDEANGSPTKKRKLGKVWSFEFHELRHQKLQKEIQDHGLEGIVEITHRDVCEEGFLVDGKSPNAESIFLDLPAPWLALPHLARSRTESRSKDDMSKETKPFISPLNPAAPVYICTFSPCIEQVQKTVSMMRQLGWVDIEMVELSQKRIEIRRERIGISTDAQRGVQSTPASVEEAIARLKEVEGTFKQFHENSGGKAKVEGGRKERRERPNPNNRESILEALVERKVYKEGRLVHRTEPEVKTHTSYLVFAVLPVEWSEEDEERARQKWDVKGDNGEEDVGGEGGSVAVPAMSRKERKRAERQAKMDADRAAKREARGATTNGASSVDAPAESIDTPQNA